MFFSIIFLSLFFRLFHQFCQSPCTECPSSYYYNKGIQFREQIDFFVDCSPKSKSDLIYSKSFYLTNIPCNSISFPSACEGDIDNPMDDFWKIIKKFYLEDEGHKFQTQEIRILLLGSPHFITYDDLLESLDTTKLKLFSDLNGSIEIMPAFCQEISFGDNCFKNNFDIVDIYLKSDMFQLAITFQLSIRNIRFLGNDLVLTNFKNNSCLRQRVICCPSFSVREDCKFENIILKLDEENLMKSSMFLLRNKNDKEIPKLVFTNVDFFNFYSINEMKLQGWNTLIFSYSSSQEISIFSLKICNFYLSFGFLYLYDNVEKFSDSEILIGNSSFENIKGYFFLTIMNSNFTMINANISFTRFFETAFDSTNWLTFLKIKSPVINFIFLQDIEISNCSNLLFISVVAHSIMINFFHILISNLSFSRDYFVYFDLVDEPDGSLDTSSIGISDFNVQNSFFENSLFLFKTNSFLFLNLNNLCFEFSYAHFLFQFQSLSNFKSFYQILFNNITLTNLKGGQTSDERIYFIYAVNSFIDTTIISNLISNDCDSIQILNYEVKYNYIMISNISISYLVNNYNSIIRICQLYSDFSLIENSYLFIQNFNLFSAMISSNSFDLYGQIYIKTYNIPVYLKVTNSSFINIFADEIFSLLSPLIKLFNLQISDLEFYDLKSDSYSLYFIYFYAPSSKVLLSNIFIQDSECFILISTSQMFNTIFLKNITFINLFYITWYVIQISQVASKSSQNSKLEIVNMIFLDVELNRDSGSPSSYFALDTFDELIIEDVVIRNMKNNAFDIFGIANFGYIEIIKIVRITNFDFKQEVWSNLDQVLRINSISEYLDVNDCKFEIAWKLPSIRRFQAFYVLNCMNVIFTNNQFIGMSTIEKTQFKYDELGIVAFMAVLSEESYYVPLSENFYLIAKNNVFKYNYGIKYGIMGLVGFTNVLMYNNTFVGNHATYGGSIACISVNYLAIFQLNVNDSKAEKEGGVIYLLNSQKVDVFDSIFLNSFSESNAGCFYAREIFHLNFKNNSIYRSFSINNGGVAYFINIQKVNFSDLLISDSSAAYGGMLVFENTNAFINNSQFKYGYSLISGGFATFNGENIDINIFTCLFFAFISEQDAAIILTSNLKNFTAVNSNFSCSLNRNEGVGIINLDGYSDQSAKSFNFFNNFFFNNSAWYGSIIYYNSNSHLYLKNNSFYLNEGTLFRFESESYSYVLIDSSLFTWTNYLSSESPKDFLSLFSFSKCFVEIMSTSIINNNGIKHLFELIMQASLLFFNSTISNFYIMTNRNSNSSNRIFYLLNSKLTSKMSRINYLNQTYERSATQCSYFEVRKSIFISQNDLYQNIFPLNFSFLVDGLESDFEIENLSIKILSSLGSIFLIKKSNFFSNNIIIMLEFSSKRTEYLFNFDGLKRESLRVIMSKLSLNFPINVISVQNLDNFEMFNSNFIVFNKNGEIFFRKGIDLMNVRIVIICDCLFKNYFSEKGSCISFVFELKTSSTMYIKNSVFLGNSAYSSGALYIRGNISFHIDQCNFAENKALLNLNVKNSGKGGCILFDCEFFNESYISITATTFENNYASILGPTVLSKSPHKITFLNITFQNNKDMTNFTTSFSSFPICHHLLLQNFIKETMEFYYNNFYENYFRTKKILSEYKLGNYLTVVSGKSFNLSLLLTDAFDQQLILDDSIKFELTCSPFSNNNRSELMIDKTSATSNKGFLFFQEITIIFIPFSFLKCNITYSYSIDSIFQSANPTERKQDRSMVVNLTIFVRECIPGEIYQIDETCFKCSFGTYAFHNPINKDLSKKCLPCPANAYCDGGRYLSPLRGYWRVNNQSHLIQKCLNVDACLGVGESIETVKYSHLFNNLTEMEKNQGICGPEYEGNLCFYCKKGLARFKRNSPCQNCDELIIIYFKMVVSLVLIIIYVFVQAKIFGNIEKDDPHFALLIKVFLNHFQTMSMMDLIDLDWNYDFNFYIYFKDYISFLSEDFFVLDCFIQKQQGGNLLVTKIIFTLFLPLLLSVFIFPLWLFTFFYFFFKEKSYYALRFYEFFSEKIRITLLVFIFILYPEILKKGFSLLNCITIDEVGKLYVLAYSPDIECWTPEHTFWVLTVSLPGIAFWGILAPLIICIILLKNKKKINYFLHQNENISKLSGIGKQKKEKSIIFKNTIIYIEKELGDKLFFGQKPLSKIEIGYIKKGQTFIESKEIYIVEKEEFEKKLNLPFISNEIRFTFNNIKNLKNNNSLIQEEEVICRDNQRVIEETSQLFKLLKFYSIKDLNALDYETNSKAIVQEKFSIEYDYKKKKELLYSSPFSDLNELEISQKTKILIRNLGFVYRGYRKEYFFWEIIMFLRKFSFIFIGIFTGLFPAQLKSFLILICLSFFLFLQLSYKPYQFEYLNKLEFCSLLTAFVTCLIGIALLSPYLNKLLILLALIILGIFYFSTLKLKLKIAINILYLIFWGKMVLRYGNLTEKLKKIILAFLLLLRRKFNKKHKNIFKNKLQIIHF